MTSNSDFGPSGPPACIHTYAHLHIKVKKIPERGKEGKREEGRENKSRVAKRGRRMWESPLYGLNNIG